MDEYSVRSAAPRFPAGGFFVYHLFPYSPISHRLGYFYLEKITTMAIPTIPQIQAMPLGYLQGLDLCRYVSAQTLISQYNVDNTCLQDGVRTAIGLIQMAARTKYDLSAEFAKLPPVGNAADTRDTTVRMLTSILAVKVACASLANIGDLLMSHIEWAEKMLRDIRGGQANFMQPLPAPVTINNADGTQTVYTPQSAGEMVQSSFLTLG